MCSLMGTKPINKVVIWVKNVHAGRTLEICYKYVINAIAKVLPMTLY